MRSILRDLRFSGVIDGFADCGAALHPMLLLQASEIDKAGSSETEGDAYEAAEVLISHDNY
jgi:hypothetical protein